MSDMLPLIFEGQSVRVVEGEDGQPWFALVDVCRILEIVNASDVASKLDEDQKLGVDLTDPHGRLQRTTAISESGLIWIIMRSDKPQAKAFQRVAIEYIKSVGKHGVALVGMDANDLADVLNDPVGLLLYESMKNRAWQVVQEKRLEAAEKRLLSLGELANDYVTVVGWFNRVGGTVTLQDASLIGKMATQLCNEAGIKMGRVKSERFGHVNSYPENIVEQAYEWFKVRHD